MLEHKCYIKFLWSFIQDTFGVQHMFSICHDSFLALIVLQFKFRGGSSSRNVHDCYPVFTLPILFFPYCPIKCGGESFSLV